LSVRCPNGKGTIRNGAWWAFTSQRRRARTREKKRKLREYLKREKRGKTRGIRRGVQDLLLGSYDISENERDELNKEMIQDPTARKGIEGKKLGISQFF